MSDQLITMLAPQRALSLLITSLLIRAIVSCPTLPLSQTNMPCTALGIATFGSVPVQFGAVADAIAGGGAAASFESTVKVTFCAGSPPSVMAIFVHESVVAGKRPSNATDAVGPLTLTDAVPLLTKRNGPLNALAHESLMPGLVRTAMTALAAAVNATLWTV